jgi:hypothetical protein
MQTQRPTKVWPSAFKRPEQITVRLSVGVHDFSISEHDLKVLHIIRRKPILPREMKESASKNQPTHADLRNTATDYTQLMRVQGFVNLSPPFSRSYGSKLLVCTQTDRVQFLEIDEDAGLTNRRPSGVGRVASATDCKLQLEEFDRLEGERDVALALGYDGAGG